ncbi:MAG: hypothetical protein OHK0045_17120 [Raineya sp.]
MLNKFFSCLEVCIILFSVTPSAFIKAQKPVFKYYQRANGLKSEYINAIFQDSKGFIWISSDKGLSRYDGKNVLHLNTDSGLPANMVYEIWEENGKIYFGVYEKGYFAWNGEYVEKVAVTRKMNQTYLKQIKNVPIYTYLYQSVQDTAYLSTPVSHLKDYENNNWIAVFGKGLFRFIPYLEYYPISDEIVNLWQDSNNTFFLLGKRGVHIIDKKMNTHFVPLKDARSIDFYQGKFYLASLYNYYEKISPEQLYKNNYLPFVHCTGYADMLHVADTRWIATFGDGLIKINKNKVDTIDVKDGLISNNLERIQKTPSALWASTYGNGVSKITSDAKITNFNQEKGLLSNIVYYVFEDSLQKEFWIANEKGISIFDAKNQKKADIKFPERVLALFYFKGSHWAVSEKYLYQIQNRKPCRKAGVYIFPHDVQFSINRVFVKNEKVYLVGSSGMSVLHLDKIPEQVTVKPRFQILEIRGRKEKINFSPQNPQITLNWKENFLKIQLATLSFLNEDENTIRYRFKELDTNWTESKLIREITLIDLNYGKHTLQLQMLDANGNHSDIINITISVFPPFWYTKWFWFVIGTLILVILGIIIRYLSFRRLRSKVKKLELQQKIQQERERIARDLHDNVGSQLTYIITDLEHTSQSVEGSLKSKLEETTEFARQAINQLRQTIWAVHQNDISGEKLEIKIRDLVWQYTKTFRHIKIAVQIDFREDLNFNAIQALNIYRILQECINNAFKHSQATEVNLQAKANKHSLEIQVRDNGSGFDIEQAIKQEHYGIKNIYKRAEEIKADLNISSSQKGTIISLIMRL